MERVKGIEPSSQAWEARILPLNHTRTGAINFYKMPNMGASANRTSFSRKTIRSLGARVREALAERPKRVSLTLFAKKMKTLARGC
jgi:hypothetical protein